MALNVELLESSFAQIKVNSLEVTEQFYTVLFTDYPEVQPLFANTHMEKQRKQLFQSLVFTVDNLDKPDVLSGALRGLGTRHIQYGVLPQHYSMVGSSLLKAFEVSLGTAWTPDVQRAWTEAYEVVYPFRGFKLQEQLQYQTEYRNEWRGWVEKKEMAVAIVSLDKLGLESREHCAPAIANW